MIYTVDLFASACVEHTSQSQIFNMLNICDFGSICHVGSSDQQHGFVMVFSTAGKSLRVVARGSMCLWHIALSRNVRKLIQIAVSGERGLSIINK